MKSETAAEALQKQASGEDNLPYREFEEDSNGE
ncbi:MAG: hypothetical protein BWY31_04114 [Lentisphaerae bacterium ADurb.Bin242]|nr:MAG: hypothetical protein BWY31_04114 [Lentisphaerae bacterium ADurb.Bin242]